MNLLPTPKTRSLKSLLATAVFNAAALTFLAGAVAYSSVEEVKVEFPKTEVTPGLTAAETEATALIQKHDCWTGEAPADMEGVIPGHVVVGHKQVEDGAPVYGGPYLVGRAFGHVFEGESPDLIVYGFCR